MADERFVAAVAVLDCSTPEALAASRAIDVQRQKKQAETLIVSCLLH
jgi:hypothetical protein